MVSTVRQLYRQQDQGIAGRPGGDSGINRQQLHQGAHRIYHQVGYRRLFLRCPRLLSPSGDARGQVGAAGG